jgi:hypothetical protein
VTTTTSYCNISWQAKRLLKGNYTVKYSLRCDGTAPAVVAAECTAANVKSRVSGRHGDLNPLLNADSRFSVVSDSAGSLVFTQVAPVKVKKAGATVLRRLGLTVVRAS